MKYIFLLLFLVTGTIISAQGNVESKRIDTIHSKILNEDRYLRIHLPVNRSGNAIKRYPVVFVLDGDAYFDEVVNIVNRLSRETGKDAANEMILVGLGNVWERYRDYSPTHITASPWVDKYTIPSTGGGDKFISFIEKELLPYTAKAFGVPGARILIGHSMGGLIAMDILLKHTGLFNYYAAIDPSMWWDEEKLLKESKTILANKNLEKNTLFLAVANTTDLAMTPVQIQKDTSAKTVLIRPGLTLVDYIIASKQNKLKFDWKYYKDYHHMTVPVPAMYDALKFFLESW